MFPAREAEEIPSEAGLLSRTKQTALASSASPAGGGDPDGRSSCTTEEGLYVLQMMGYLLEMQEVTYGMLRETGLFSGAEHHFHLHEECVGMSRSFLLGFLLVSERHVNTDPVMI